MNIEDKNRQYLFHIQYDEKTSSREFFSDIASLMISIDKLNNAIAHSFGNDIETEALISEIQGGSIKIWIRDNLKKLPDDKIKAYVNNPREAIADLLITTKHKIIKSLEEKPKQIPSNAPEIIEAEILDSPLKDYGYKVHKIELLEAIGELSDSANKLPFPPSIEIGGEKIIISTDYKFNVEELEDIKKQERTIHQNFIIKKPDIIGDSKWTLIFDKNIDVRIDDNEFKEKVKNRDISISHGDMLDAELLIEVYLDDDMNVVETRYTIIKVYDIIPPKENGKQDLLDLN